MSAESELVIRGEAQCDPKHVAADKWIERIQNSTALVMGGKLKLAAGATVRLDANGIYEPDPEQSGSGEDEGDDSEKQTPLAVLSEAEALLKACGDACGGLGAVYVFGGFGRDMDGGELEGDVLRLVAASATGSKKALKSLTLSGDQSRNTITAGDTELAALLEGQPLETLRLPAHLALSEDVVAELARGCPRLHSLSANFEDDEALAATAGFEYLKELVVYGASPLGAGLTAIADGAAGRSLRRLDATSEDSNPPGFTLEGLQALARMPRLEHVGCPITTDEEGPEVEAALEALKKRFSQA